MRFWIPHLTQSRAGLQMRLFLNFIFAPTWQFKWIYCLHYKNPVLIELFDLHLLPSLSSIWWHLPSQALGSAAVSSSRPSHPWLAAWHQPLGWLPLPAPQLKAKQAHASQRYTNLSSFWNTHVCVLIIIILFSADKPRVRLTSDSPALNGSLITFTARLEYPPCQKEDANGELVWDERCEDGVELEASGAAGRGHGKHITPPSHIPATPSYLMSVWKQHNKFDWILHKDQESSRLNIWGICV